MSLCLCVCVIMVKLGPGDIYAVFYPICWHGSTWFDSTTGLPTWRCVFEYYQRSANKLTALIKFVLFTIVFRITNGTQTFKKRFPAQTWVEYRFATCNCLKGRQPAWRRGSRCLALLWTRSIGDAVKLDGKVLQMDTQKQEKLPLWEYGTML